LALLIEAIAASFGDSKPDLSLDKYLPYPLEDNSEVVEKAFLHNEELFKILESMKKNP